MKINEIINHCNLLIQNIDRLKPRVDDMQAVLDTLEDSIFYDDSTHHESAKYLKYIRSIIDYAHLVKDAKSYADLLRDYKNDLCIRLTSLRKHVTEIQNFNILDARLVNVILNCENNSGDMYSVCGDLRERMLSLCGLIERENIVAMAFECLKNNFPYEYDFCYPWFIQYQNDDFDALEATFDSLGAALHTRLDHGCNSA